MQLQEVHKSANRPLNLIVFWFFALVLTTILYRFSATVDKLSQLLSIYNEIHITAYL